MSQRLKQLSTERTTISEYSEHDLELLIKLEQCPDVMQYLEGVELDLQKNQQKFQGILDFYAAHPGLGVWKACLKDGSHLGHAVLNRPELSSTGLREGPIQVGYLLHKKFWGEGYATELATELLNYAFNNLQVDSVIAITDKKHLGSRRVMEKIGMQSVGMTTEFYNHELILYQLDHGDLA